MTVAELPETRRKWRAWAILDYEKRLYRITTDDPEQSEPIQRLIGMGWQAVPVNVVEADG